MITIVFYPYILYTEPIRLIFWYYFSIIEVRYGINLCFNKKFLKLITMKKKNNFKEVNHKNSFIK